MTRRPLLALLAAVTLGAAGPAPPVRVLLDTSAGPIMVALETRKAPITSANFLRYVDGHKFDGTYFYRAARAPGSPKVGLVEGGIDGDLRRSYPPIPHEPTSRTGLRHGDGTLSMARDAPGTAMGDFFITIGPNAYLDAGRKDPGYAAFGHVTAGMAIVKTMLAAPTYKGGYSHDTKGQAMVKPVLIRSAKRVR